MVTSPLEGTAGVEACFGRGRQGESENVSLIFPLSSTEEFQLWLMICRSAFDTDKAGSSIFLYRQGSEAGGSWIRRLR